MPPTKRVIVDIDVQDYIRVTLSQAPDTQDCLIGVFKRLGQGRLAYGPDVIDPRFHAVDQCGFTILFSDRGNTLYITELIFPARNGLRGILGP